MALLAIILLVITAPAEAKRLALVIGNDAYQHADPLGNARADAKAVAEALKATNFKVTLRQDVTLQTMKEALRAFKNEVAGGDEVVFYYAGHGVQLEGNNYMIPVDTAGDSADQLKDDSVSLQRVLDDMQDQKARFTLAIIDACRNNPFKGNGRALRTRGLAPVTAADGQAVLYSAGAGQEALDNLGSGDKDPNGVFTRVLIRQMKTPGLSFDQVIHEVRSQVVQLAKSVNQDQTPGYYSQFTGDFYFIPPAPGQPLASAPVPPAAAPSAAGHGASADEIAAFKAAESSNSVPGWQIFKRNYPNSAYATTADIRLATLTQPQAPLVSQPPPQAPARASAQPPAQSVKPEVDPLIVGTFELEGIVDDYDQRYVYTVTADGRFRLLMTQQENGLFQSANGVFRTIGARTHRVRTGTYRAVGADAIEVTSAAGSAVFRPAQPSAPVNPMNPVMLGTWRASVLQGGVNWTLTLQNNANGSFEYTAQAEDSGTCGYANNQWHLASAVTGQTDMGTYRIVDARSVEFAGLKGSAIWKRR